MTDPHTQTITAARHSQADLAATWGDFADAEPELAAFVAERLQAAPAYLATVRASGLPRVHPVTPIITVAGLYLFMEPTSPKGVDLHERGWFALHNGVTDHAGTGGEAALSGTGRLVTDDAVRTTVAAAASYRPADRYVLYDLGPTEAQCRSYGDTTLPERRRWHAGADAPRPRHPGATSETPPEPLTTTPGSTGRTR